MLEVYIRHGMIVDKVQGLIPYKQSKWLENIQFLMHKRRTKP